MEFEACKCDIRAFWVGLGRKGVKRLRSPGTGIDGARGGAGEVADGPIGEVGAEERLQQSWLGRKS